MADAGLDVRNADLFVGTSAGARVALDLPSGQALEEIYQRRAGPDQPRLEPSPVIDWARLRADLDDAKQEGGSPAEILRRYGALALKVAVGKGSDRRKIVASQIPLQAWPQQGFLSLL
jgi:NTE family protein